MITVDEYFGKDGPNSTKEIGIEVEVEGKSLPVREFVDWNIVRRARWFGP